MGPMTTKEMNILCFKKVLLKKGESKTNGNEGENKMGRKTDRLGGEKK